MKYIEIKDSTYDKLCDIANYFMGCDMDYVVTELLDYYNFVPPSDDNDGDWCGWMAPGMKQSDFI